MRVQKQLALTTLNMQSLGCLVHEQLRCGWEGAVAARTAVGVVWELQGAWCGKRYGSWCAARSARPYHLKRLNHMVTVILKHFVSRKLLHMGMGQ